MARMAARTGPSTTARAGDSTTAVHAGEIPDARTGAVNVPVHLSSTFWYPELPGGGKATHIYSRYTNPSVEAVEAKLAALEGAAGSLLFSSGMGAIQTVCTALTKPRDTIAVQQGVYGGTTAYLTKELARFGVRVRNLGPVEPPRLPKGTRIVWMESITNPLLRVADVRAWADAAHDAGALLVVDATFASPVLQRPLRFGADLVLHSATKYLGGHSDLVAGAVSWPKGPRVASSRAGESSTAEDIWRVRRNAGPSLDAHAAFLLGRGMKTLALRMERHCKNAQDLAEALAGDSRVKRVHYPGLPEHPDHATARRLLGGFGGMLTLDLGTKAKAVAFRRRVRLLAPAASLGGVESLVSLPLETSHAYSTAAERRRDGIGDGLVRISVGIEDIGDLLADMDRGLGGAR